MDLALLIEARNFRNGYVDEHPGSAIRYDRLVAVIERETGGRVKYVTVYTAYDPRDNGLQAPARDLWWLAGHGADVEIKHYKTKTKQYECQGCQEEYSVVQDKQIDAAMTADAIDFVTTRTVDGGTVQKRVDGVVFGTSDHDILPAIEAIEDRFGGHAWMAGWHVGNVDAPIIQLDRYADEILCRPDPVNPETVVTDGMVAELERAAIKFNGGYIGLHVFMTRWRGQQLPDDPRVRYVMLNALIQRGLVEVYKAPDGNMAVRLTGKDQAAPAQIEASHA